MSSSRNLRDFAMRAASVIVPPQGELSAVMEYILVGGKRMRPALSLALAEVYGFSLEDVAPFLRAVEFVHSASLALDDLPQYDNAQKRRGQQATHLKFSEAATQLASFGLIAGSFVELSKLKVNPIALSGAIEYFASCIGRMVSGQYGDIEGHSRIQSEHQMEHLYELKSSSSFELSMVPIAILAERDYASLEAFSRHLGVAYQIFDDFRDVREDVRTERQTLVSFLGNNKAEERLQYHEHKARSLLKEIGGIYPLEELLDYIKVPGPQ